MGQYDDPERPDQTLRPFITLVSTHTRDHMPSTSGQGTVEMPGGPAHYIGQALERLNWPYRLITGQVPIVEVIPRPEGEEYIIPPIERIPLPSRLEGDAVVLSPVIGEIDAAAVPPTEGMLVIDVQGFVREPSKPSGTASRRFNLRDLFRRAAIVKGAHHELALLDDESRAELKNIVLITTRGRHGSVVRDCGREHLVPARYIPITNTVGAGDTYLAGFVCAFLGGCSAAEAGVEAARFTETFLEERLRSEESAT